MEKLTEIVKELIDRGVLFTGVSIRNGELAYEMLGFAKSGSGTLYMDGDRIKLETRYNQVDDIGCVRDVVRVAHGWDCCYCAKENNYNVFAVNPVWKKMYDEYGFGTDGLILQ